MSAPDTNAQKVMADLRARSAPLNERRVATHVVIGVPVRGAPVGVDPGAFMYATPTEWRDLVPGVSTAHTALSRAIGNAKKGVKDDGGASWMWRKVGVDKAGVLVYALIRQTTDVEAREWIGDARCTIEVAKDGAGGLRTSAASVPRAVAEELERVAKRYEKERSKLTQSDVREVINGVVLKRLRGVRIGGTSSFVVLRGPDERLEDLAEPLRLAGVDVISNEVYEDGGRRLGSAIKRGLLDECDDLGRKAQEILDDVRAGKKVRAETILDRMEDLKAILDKGAAFEGFLEMGLADIKATIKQVRGVLLDAAREGEGR